MRFSAQKRNMRTRVKVKDIEIEYKEFGTSMPGEQAVALAKVLWEMQKTSQNRRKEK